MPAVAGTAPARSHPTLVLVTLAGTTLAVAMQTALVVPALPRLRDELGTSTEWATWLLTIFMLASAVATPIAARLGDQHGRGRLLLVSLGIFFAGCVGCAASWDIASLIAFRAVQG